MSFVAAQGIAQEHKSSFFFSFLFFLSFILFYFFKKGPLSLLERGCYTHMKGELPEKEKKERKSLQKIRPLTQVFLSITAMSSPKEVSDSLKSLVNAVSSPVN